MNGKSGEQPRRPKSSGEIRAALRSLGAGQRGSAQQGPLAEGPSAHHRIVIGNFHDPDVARSYQRELTRSGILSRFARQGRLTQVSVDYEDHQLAAQILDQHHQHTPDQRPTGIRREYDYLIFGIAVGLALGFIYVFGNLQHPAALAAPSAFAITGALTGHLIDRLRGHWRRHRGLRFGVWELLILAVLPALLAFILHLMPKLLR